MHYAYHKAMLIIIDLNTVIFKNLTNLVYNNHFKCYLPHKHQYDNFPLGLCFIVLMIKPNTLEVKMLGKSEAAVYPTICLLEKC